MRDCTLDSFFCIAMGNSELDLGIGIGGVQHTTVSMAYEYGFTLASL
jgi:hypothetical protein